jgi:hypothetical protein
MISMSRYNVRCKDQPLGAELLEYMLTDTLAGFDEQRLVTSTTLLCNDLLRQGDGGVDFEANSNVTVAGVGDFAVPILAVKKSGKRFAIALSGPLTTDHPADPAIRELREKTSDIHVIVVNELLVRGNLPAATREVQERLDA